ncbi:hypothetical protein BD309DRAFT_1011571 [Dichomitus squalens]|nr:hypothetical protein BD309DRAFT_1011571 [Dichomitus squalens]
MSQPDLRDRPTVAISFYGCQRIVSFRPVDYHRSDINAKSFAPLPEGVIVTSLPKDRGIELTYEEYTTEHLSSDIRSSLIFRGVLDAPQDVEPPTVDQARFILKVAAYTGLDEWGQAMMWKFVHEAWFFKDRLSVVQGEAVPRHYGVWCGKAEWGAELAISIMQFGGYSYLRYFRDTEYDTDARKAILRAYAALHKAGIKINNFSETTKQLLYDWPTKKAFLVDLGHADVKHQCGLRVDLDRDYPANLPADVFGCSELLLVHRLIGKTKPIPYRLVPEMEQMVKNYDEEFQDEKSPSNDSVGNATS